MILYRIDGYGDLDKERKSIIDLIFNIYLESVEYPLFPVYVVDYRSGLGHWEDDPEIHEYLEDYFRVNILTLLILGLFRKLEKGHLKEYFRHLSYTFKHGFF